MLTVVSLCTGYGGLELGIEQAWGPVDVVCVAENDPKARIITETHHPDVPNVGDITTVRWQDVVREHPQIKNPDILTAGYPCQPFSTAGRQHGKEDPRHIWPHVARAIRCLRPGVVVCENVRGHVRLGLHDVISDLAHMGYVGRWGVVRASDAGACHRRERVFIVASHADRRRLDRHPQHHGTTPQQEADDQSRHDPH